MLKRVFHGLSISPPLAGKVPAPTRPLANARGWRSSPPRSRERAGNRMKIMGRSGIFHEHHMGESTWMRITHDNSQKLVYTYIDIDIYIYICVYMKYNLLKSTLKSGYESWFIASWDHLNSKPESWLPEGNLGFLRHITSWTESSQKTFNGNYHMLLSFNEDNPW